MRKQYGVSDIVLNNWKLVRLIGEGSFGRVFEAERKDFGTTYKAAIKIITIPQSQSEIRSVRADGMDDDSAKTYFRGLVEDLVQEFALMSRLKGTANVVSYEDHTVIEHSEGIGWDIIIRMELLTPLFDYSSNKAFTRQDVTKLGVDICRALELCQKFNIIHRDIKPDNIFVSDLGDYKLGDFGIARTVEKTTGGLSKKGTYNFMAPEVYRGNAYGSCVDLYSLGLVLYRLLNDNRAPFVPAYPAQITHNDSELARAKRFSGERLPSPRNADGRLAEIVLKACAYDAKDRYSSPMQMREELEAILYSREETPIIYPKGDGAPIESVEYVDTGSSDDDRSIKADSNVDAEMNSEPDKTEILFGNDSDLRGSDSAFGAVGESKGRNADTEVALGDGVAPKSVQKKEFKQQFCTYCRTSLSKGFEFCTRCGIALKLPQTNLRPNHLQPEPKTKPKKEKYMRPATIIPIMVVVALVVMLMILIPGGGQENAVNDGLIRVTPTAEPTPEPSPTPTPTPTPGDEAGSEPEPTPEPVIEVDWDVDVILAFSSDRLLRAVDLEGLSLAQLRIARNEIFARHGMIFREYLLSRWFESTYWYHEISPKHNRDDFFALQPYPLSRIEIENVDFISAREEYLLENERIFPFSDIATLSEFDLALSTATLEMGLDELYYYAEVTFGNVDELSSVERYNADSIEQAIINQRASLDAEIAPESAVNGRSVVMHDNRIFFANPSSENRIYSMNIDGTDRRRLNDNEAHSLIVVDNRIFFVNMVNRDLYWYTSTTGVVYSMNLDGSDLRRLTDDEIGSLSVDGNRIFYSTFGPDTDSGIFSMNLDGNDRQLIDDMGAVRKMIVASDQILYICWSRRELFFMNKDGTNRQGLSRQELSYCEIGIYVVRSRIFYRNSNGVISSMNIDGSNRRMLGETTDAGIMTVSGNSIYYAFQDGIYSMSLNGNNQRRLFDIEEDMLWRIYAIGDRFFYYVWTWEDNLMRLISINKDGTDRQEIT